MDTIFTVVLIIVIIVTVFAIILFFSLKLRGKMFSRQFKTMRYMMEESQDDIAKLGKTGVGIKKQILDENQKDLEDIAEKEAKIRNIGIKGGAKAIKEGFTEKDKVYCKYCGSEIDNDSKFCKNCGKEQ